LVPGILELLVGVLAGAGPVAEGLHASSELVEVDDHGDARRGAARHRLGRCGDDHARRRDHDDRGGKT